MHTFKYPPEKHAADRALYGFRTLIIPLIAVILVNNRGRCNGQTQHKVTQRVGKPTWNFIGFPSTMIIFDMNEALRGSRGEGGNVPCVVVVRTSPSISNHEQKNDIEGIVILNIHRDKRIQPRAKHLQIQVHPCPIGQGCEQRLP